MVSNVFLTKSLKERDSLKKKCFLKLNLYFYQGTSYHEACQQYPDIINKLHALDKEISGGTTGTVVLIHQNKLYVANVGK